MFDELNEKLAELYAQKKQREHAERRLEAVGRELADAERERDRLRRVWLAERKDVERLKGLSFGALFFALAGKRRERLSKEEEELLQAKLRLEEAEDAVNDLAAERNGLKRLLWRLADVDAKIAAVMAEKERLIRERHPGLAGELEELTNREAEESAMAKELEEAAAAGRKVLRELERAENLLRSARNWGVYDMLGGGMISTAIKHNRIDEARAALHAAQTAMARFRKELQDVARDAALRLETGPLLKFGDYLLDGLLFDWIVQGKIDEALAQNRRESARVRRIVDDLEQTRDRCRSRLADLRRRREALIRDA